MSCAPPVVVVGGVVLSTSDLQNARELLSKVGSYGDPTLDEYEENVSNGNNSSGKHGILLPNTPDGTIPTQTTLPPPIPEAAAASNDKIPPGGNGTKTSCSMWDGNYDVALSSHFKLREFTVNALFPYPLIDYNQQYNRQVRFCNLQNLAANVAEPLLAKYGKFRVNSGIRNKTSTTSGLSQHITGEAMDVQWAGWNYERYWEAAQWVKDNIQYDQFIFEHGNSPWLHLSFRIAGNRPPDIRTKVMTMYRNNYSPGLKKYG